MTISGLFMFVKVSCIFGEQKRVLLAVKKKKTNNMQHKKKEKSVKMLFLSLEPTWSGLNNMTIFFVRRFSFLNHSRQRKEALQGAKFGIK